jgi:hypothetical protein
MWISNRAPWAGAQSPGRRKAMTVSGASSRRLVGRTIPRTPQGDDGVRRIFAAAGPTLATVDPGVMDEQNSDAAPSKLQQPVLHGQPAVAGTFTAVGQQR